MANSMLLVFLFMAVSTAENITDLIQNPDFESPPTNITSNTTSRPFLLQNETNKIPGWSFNGTVRYVTSGPNISLPENGHGVQLGQNGKINQTIKPNGDYDEYVLTFTLAAGNRDCSQNSTAVNVSTPGRFKVFSLERRYGKEMWESHAFYFASWDDDSGVINLEVKSVSPETDPSVHCGPVVDSFVIGPLGAPIQYGDNLVVNGGLEVGPAFPKNSTEGILLDQEPDQLQSPLQQWSITGTVKYIDSKHYRIPQGTAAIELVSNNTSGILTTLQLSKDSTYTLEFAMGDANDSCVADFLVQAQAGTISQNFTMKSNGTGSAQNHSITFKAQSSVIPISFVSLNQYRRIDGILCGPVIDNVVVRSSSGCMPELPIEVLIVFLVVTIVQIIG